MKKLSSYAVWLLSFALLFAHNAFSQSQQNYHSGNKLRVTFSNTGRIEAPEDLTVEWPIGTGHEYLKLAFPIVAVESNTQRTVAFFAPLSSFGGSDGNLVAMSHRPETWPANWPDRPASWSGQWNGYFGRGRLNADQESLLVLEDSALGLRLTVRGWQWSHYLAQDMLFLYYELTNTGTATYDHAAFGFFTDPDAGGDSNDDSISLDRSKATVVAVDADDVGIGSGLARDIGNWSPVGHFAVAVLETPGIASDGIDNDGDGMIDESRSDGIDNDNDWNPQTDDVGADGVADSGDEGEGDGLPTLGEPHFDATDIDESDQIGLTSFAEFAEGELDASDANQVWTALAKDRFDQNTNSDEFLLGSGDFSLAPGETQRFSVVLFLSVNNLDQGQNEDILQQIYQDNYIFPIAPPRPKVTVVPMNKSVTLYWDNRAEQARDFEGYKIYRSTDPGFNDVFTVTNDRGILIYSEPIATFDLDNNVKGLFDLQFEGFRYFLGRNTGLRHWWTDNNIVNGKTYYYAVVAFDRGEADAGVFPTESTKSIVVDPEGTILTDVNTVVVTPTVESSVFQSPDFSIEHTAGFATGTVEVEVVDRTLIQDGRRFQLTFDDTSTNQTTFSLTDVTDPGNPITIFARSQNFSTDEFRNDADPLFSGLHTFLFDSFLGWDSLGTRWKIGDSNWSIKLSANSNLGRPEPVAADYEVRFGEAGSDTALFSTPIPVPFQVWNVNKNVKENILVLDQNRDGAWSSGELIFIVSGNTLQNFKPIRWAITLTAPADSAVTSVPPENGDVAFISTFKPFTSQDVYVITTKAASVKTQVDKSVLDDIAVVPNPYIVNSSFEQRSLFTGGQLDRRIQFINLPPKCTVRIFTLRGRLIDTIEHDSSIDNGSAFWDLRTDEGDVVAYGIYIYHIEAPEIGQKLGRFAIIR
ncbi:MAG: hypothetical protein ACE5HO_11625 [bacterium]